MNIIISDKAVSIIIMITMLSALLCWVNYGKWCIIGDHNEDTRKVMNQIFIRS
jgi:hypothetical protein